MEPKKLMFLMDLVLILLLMILLCFVLVRVLSRKKTGRGRKEQEGRPGFSPGQPQNRNHLHREILNAGNHGPGNASETEAFPMAPEEMDGYCVVLQYQGTTQAWNLPFQSQLLLGREADCDLVLSSIRVSRHHCVLESRPDGVYLRDCPDVKNRTIVDRMRVAGDRLLQPGANLQIGDEVLIVEDIRRIQPSGQEGIVWDGESLVLSQDAAPSDGDTDGENLNP